MGLVYCLLVIFLQLFPSAVCQVTDFVSLDCGGTGSYSDTNTGLTWVSDAVFIKHGNVAETSTSDENGRQYKHHRYFPADSKKYCYTLTTVQRRRYLIRATFQYGISEDGDPYPVFQLYLDSTKWSDITITVPSRVYIEELIIRAPSASVDVCVCCASTGYPFISTLELRPFNASMYATDYEDEFFLKVAARVNFGALSKDAIRYPDDPYDRIWESDLARRQNYLVGVASGTERISTSKKIDTSAREFPPVKVLQTAVVGTQGSLSYRLNLYGFPANARAYAYLAEIEDLGVNETRKFTMQKPTVPGYNNIVVNIEENANGRYTLYEPSYMNVSLDFVLSFSFQKTWDSTRGPLLNAIEISKYVQIVPKTDSRDANVLNALRAMWPQNSMNEDGDPCIPAQWQWVNCSLSMPSRITKIALSGKDLKGEIPSELNNMDYLTEMWLDSNSLTGYIPDMSNLIGLTVVHLENNRLTGQLPSYLGDLPNLRELYVQNNSLSGKIPPALLSGKLVFKYNDNPELFQMDNHKSNIKFILGTSIGAFLIFVLITGTLLLLQYIRRKATQRTCNEKSNSLRIMSKPSTSYSRIRGGSLYIDDGLDVTLILFTEIEEATQKFSTKIGKGSFGSVYYGKMKDGKEVAVKILADASHHGTKQFENEVALLSRIHHRNLVPFIGFCDEESQRILVYEYMHNGTLRDHIHDCVKQKHLNWLSRLSIAEDAAKGPCIYILLLSFNLWGNKDARHLLGLEYLHSGCSPSIIHRDVKTSNILLDINMRAKVSDFGLSKQTDENLTHISSVAKGTVGYLDPEYYATQQLTEKSDVYSFGVVLLELISGRKPVSTEDYGVDWNIVHWARSLIHKGNINSIIDPLLAESFKIESVWRVAEVALQSVEPHGVSRPKMQEVVLTIQEAIKIEKGSENTREIFSSPSIQSSQMQLQLDPLDA